MESTDMETHRIRSATVEDVSLLMELIRDLAEFERLSHEVVLTEEKLRASLFGEKPPAQVILIDIGEGGGWKNAGFCLFFTSYSTFLSQTGMYVEDLYVRPEYRGRGLGRRLLVHVAKLAVERGAGRLEWAVLNWNEHAWKFYAKLGAKPMSDWTIHRLSNQALRDLAREENED
jgi:GNAT superfamily N-acetyltransferase